MNPYAAYQRHEATASTRIDLLLDLFDGAIQRLEKAIAALKQGDKAAAEPLLLHTQLLVGGLAAGVIPDGTETTTSMMRLYEFVIHSLKARGLEEVTGALCVLQFFLQA